MATTKKTIRQDDVRSQLALATRKGLIDQRGKITDEAMRKAFAAMGQKYQPKKDDVPR